MKIIARKNGSYTGYAIMCFAFAALFILGCIIGMVGLSFIWYAFLPALIGPAVFIPVGFYCLKFTKLPQVLIAFDEGKLRLYDGRSLALSDIKDISYKHASSRYGTYKFGRVVFVLKNSETIKVYPVSDIENVGKELSKLIYGQQNNQIQ